MNAQRIRLIIGLLTAALIGVICLQIYWISWSIRLNEEAFDKIVYAALNRVADKLQSIEDWAVIDALNSVHGFSSEANRNIRSATKLLENGQATRRITRADSLPNPSTGDQSFEDNMTMYEYMKVSQLVDSKPLAERIPLDVLAIALKEELSSRGITTQYQYGVYSKSRNSFVVVNDHYVVVDNSPQVTHGGAATLFNSPYRVALFQKDIESPGYLSIYFPNRTSMVLGSVWKTLLLSVIFTGIILFCFWYTIQVIYQQKKLSEMKTDFINNMTHEFKTPIATISLATDSISSPMVVNNPDKIKRFVDIIRQENRRMNSQVERVLQMALIDKKDFQLTLAEVNLHDLIQQAADNFSLQVEKREGKLETDLRADRPGLGRLPEFCRP
ncbi:MAG TPA: HAMP domain-containing sensor histidine kinase, partial [Saprospiraceae bacterium]|nr:HAMP domain-containing sensor histidine kinase [Saprospiraceae bacterium]